MSKISVLIVEDSNDKLRKIVQVLNGVPSFDSNSAEYAHDVQTAKNFLKARAFDLVILDIALPTRSDSEVLPDAGINLLTEVLAHPTSYRVPAHIVGITAYEDVFASANRGFSSRLLTLIQYDPASSDWEHSLQARVRHIIESIGAQSPAPDEFKSSISVVCALHSPELTAVLALPWNWQQITVPNDHVPYWQGTFEREGERRVVYAACAARMGMPAASVLATKMVHAFRPKYLAMTGITGGVRGRVNLGDVIVADPCWDWGNGKWVTEDERNRFLGAPHQIALSVDLREHFKSIARNHALLADVRGGWPADPPDNALKIHIGPLASGASVLADKNTITRITEQHRQLLGIEMEAYGVFTAAEEVSSPRPQAFAIKSVVDFADGEKNDRIQAYAAYVSAQILGHLSQNFL